MVSGSISYCVKSVCRSTIIIWTLGLWIISEAHVVVICGKYIQTCTLTRFTMRYWVEQSRWAGLPGQPPQSDYRLLLVSEEQSAALWPSMSSAFCFFFALFTAAKVLTLFKENICIWWPSQKETRLLKDGCTVVNVCAILLYNITWPFEKMQTNRNGLWICFWNNWFLTLPAFTRTGVDICFTAQVWTITAYTVLGSLYGYEMK